MSKPPATSATQGTDDLRRSLGAGSIVFMVVAFAAPLGVVVANFPLIISVSGTVNAPLYIAVAGIILILFSVGFTRMSRRVVNAGAFYTYVMKGLGRVPGLGAATLALISYLLLVVGIAAYIGVAASALIAFFVPAVTVPWWVFAFVALLVIALLGYRDIDLSAKVLGIFLVVEIVVVAILTIVIFIKGGPDGHSLSALSPSSALHGAPGLGLLFSFLGYFGFEATAVFRNEARDPDRTIPRATYIAVISIAVFYSISSWATVIGLGETHAVAKATADPSNLIAGLARSYVGPVLADAFQVLIVTSMFACTLSIHNALTRYTYTLGSQGVFPGGLGRIHQSHRSPHRASLTISAASIAGLLIVTVLRLDPVAQTYAWFTGAASVGIITLMTVTSVSVIVHFRRSPDRSANVAAVLIAPILAGVGLLGVLALTVGNLPLLVGSQTAAWVVLGFLVAVVVVGLVLGLVLKVRRPNHYLALVGLAPDSDPEPITVGNGLPSRSEVAGS